MFRYNFLHLHPCLPIWIKFTNVSLNKSSPVYCSDEQSLLSSWKKPQSRGIHWSRSNTSCKGLWNLKPDNHTTSRSAPTSLNWSASILFSHHRDSDFRCVELSSKEASPELMQFHCCLLNFQVKKSCHFLPKYKLDSCNWLLLLCFLSLHAPKRGGDCSGTGSSLAHRLVNQVGQISPTSFWTPTFVFWASV